LDGTYHHGRGRKGKAVALTYEFSGSQITVWYIGYKNRGRAKVLVDGKRVGFIDQYRSQVQFGLSQTFSNLGSGVHRIKIKNAGAKNANATDTIIAIDALE
jgi:hypothetical protein